MIGESDFMQDIRHCCTYTTCTDSQIDSFYFASAPHISSSRLIIVVGTPLPPSSIPPQPAPSKSEPPSPCLKSRHTTPHPQISTPTSSTTTIPTFRRRNSLSKSTQEVKQAKGKGKAKQSKVNETKWRNSERRSWIWDVSSIHGMCAIIRRERCLRSLRRNGMSFPHPAPFACVRSLALGSLPPPSLAPSFSKVPCLKCLALLSSHPLRLPPPPSPPR